MSSIRSHWSTRSAWTRCATSSCARCRSGRTAATARTRSSAASTPTSRTSWATWRNARCRWSPRTSTASSRSPGSSPREDAELLAAADGLLERVRGSFRRHRHALGARGDLVGARRGQQVLLRAGALGAAQDRRDEARDRFATVLYTTLETVRIAALLSQPVMPESMGKLLDLLGQPEDRRTFEAIGTRLVGRDAAARPGRCLPPLSGGVMRTSRASCHISATGGVLRVIPARREQETPESDRAASTRAVVHRRRICRHDGRQPPADAAPTSTSRWSIRGAKFVERIRLHQLVAGNYDATVDYGTLLGEGDRPCRRQRRPDRHRRAEPEARRRAARWTTTTSSTRSAAPAACLPRFRARPNSPIRSASSSRRRRLRYATRRVAPRAPITVVGAGLTGIEAAAELAEQGRSQSRWSVAGCWRRR